MNCIIFNIHRLKLLLRNGFRQHLQKQYRLHNLHLHRKGKDREALLPDRIHHE
jgi:hypothetical protein